MCPSSPSSHGEVSISVIALVALALVALALVALAFFIALVVIIFTALAVAVSRCLLSAAITHPLAACLLSADVGAAAASCPPAEPVLPLVVLYFIMADCYVVALAPVPSSHCCSCHHCCHRIMILSSPATLMEESHQKGKKEEKVYF